MVKLVKSNILFSLWKFNLTPTIFQNKGEKYEIAASDRLHSLHPVRHRVH